MERKKRRWLWRILGALLFLLGFVPSVAIALLAIDEDPPPIDDLVGFRREVPDEANGFVVLDLQSGDVTWPEGTSEDLAFETDELEDGDGGIDPVIGEEKVFADSAFFDAQAAEDLLEGHRDVLERLERSLEAPDFQFGVVESYDDIEPVLDDFHELVWLLTTRARLELERREPAAALDCLNEVFTIGRRVQEGQGSMLRYLQGIGAVSSGLNLLLDWPSPVPPDRNLCRTALSMLDDELVPAAALEDMLRAEFVAFDRLIEAIARGDPDNRLGPEARDRRRVARWRRPFFLPNQSRRLGAEYTRAVIDAAGMPYRDRHVFDPAERFGLKHWTGCFRNFIGKSVLGLTCVGIDSALHVRDGLLAQLRATRVILALRGYREEHGALPERLEDLVPAWLAAVPEDPYSGEPLRYDRQRGIVYSVGKDLEDAGGSDEGPRIARGDDLEPTFTIDPPPLETFDLRE